MASCPHFLKFLPLKSLHDKLTEKDAIISEIVAENIRLKKKSTGEI